MHIMSLTDLNPCRTYDPEVCPDPVAEFYSSALSRSVAYDRNAFTFTANEMVAAAAGLDGLLRNDERVCIICEPTELPAEVHQAMIAGHAKAPLDAVPPDHQPNQRPRSSKYRGYRYQYPMPLHFSHMRLAEN